VENSEGKSKDKEEVNEGIMKRHDEKNENINSNNNENNNKNDAILISRKVISRIFHS